MYISVAHVIMDHCQLPWSKSAKYTKSSLQTSPCFYFKKGKILKPYCVMCLEVLLLGAGFTCQSSGGVTGRLQQVLWCHKGLRAQPICPGRNDVKGQKDVPKLVGFLPVFVGFMAVVLVGFKRVCNEKSTLSVLACLPVLLPSFVCFVRSSEDSFGVVFIMGQVQTQQLTALSALSDLCALCLWSTNEKNIFNVSKYVPE